MTGTASPHIGHHDFSHIPIHAKESGAIPTANARGKEEEEKTGLIDAAGQRLEPRLRSWFEQRLGQDLGDVRIYRGAQADGATRKHAALAATVGRRIAINSAVGELNTGAGLLTLAHELIQKDASGPVSEKRTLEKTSELVKLSRRSTTLALQIRLRFQPRLRNTDSTSGTPCFFH